MSKEPKFKIGQRVKLSDEGRARNLMPKARIDIRGKIVRVDELNTPTVLWDGYKTPKGYWPTFIAPVRSKP